MLKTGNSSKTAQGLRGSRSYAIFTFFTDFNSPRYSIWPLNKQELVKNMKKWGTAKSLGRKKALLKTEKCRKRVFISSLCLSFLNEQRTNHRRLQLLMSMIAIPG